jgi:hypothetical protein
MSGIRRHQETVGDVFGEHKAKVSPLSLACARVLDLLLCHWHYLFVILRRFLESSHARKGQRRHTAPRDFPQRLAIVRRFRFGEPPQGAQP